MCDHDSMEKLDELRSRVELWGCSFCEHEEVRVYTNVLTGEYVIA